MSKIIDNIDRNSDRIICVMHSRDNDGFCSGAVMNRYFPNAKMIGYDYGQPIPQEVLDAENADLLVVADVSFQMKDFAMLSTKYNLGILWIDHHVSAFKDYESFFTDKSDVNIEYIYDDKISACEACWTYFFPEQAVPMVVNLLGIYDTFRKGEPLWNNAYNFQFGMKAICNGFYSFPKGLLEYSDDFSVEKQIDMMISNGITILGYQEKMNQANCIKNAFEINLDGYRAICMNDVSHMSMALKSAYNPEKHDVMVMFYRNKSGYCVSIYTDKDDIDCSQIAKSHGGGGHRKAAGFNTNNLDDVNMLLNPNFNTSKSSE